jgi:hypothetical protein
MLVRADSMDLIVRSPSGSLQRIRQLAKNMGGFLVSSQVSEVKMQALVRSPSACRQRVLKK